MLIPNSRAPSAKLFWLILRCSKSLCLNTVLVRKLNTFFFFSSRLTMNRYKIVWITVFILCFLILNNLFGWFHSFRSKFYHSYFWWVFCHHVFVGCLYSKTLHDYICEESVEKEAESKDAVIKRTGRKELGMVLCLAKKWGFWLPPVSLPPLHRSTVYSLYCPHLE